MNRPRNRRAKKRTNNEIDNGYYPECTDVNKPCESIYSTESLINLFPMADHLVNYNEILEKLVHRKAYSLSPCSNSPSYDDWKRSNDNLTAKKSIEDALKTRIEMTGDKFLNRKWLSRDVISYLTSRRPRHYGSFISTSSTTTRSTTLGSENPIVMMAVKNRNKTEAQIDDSSKAAGKGKPHKAKSAKSTSKSPKISRSKSHDKIANQEAQLKEPVFPHKYKPTYKLSNFDYLKKGWTKLPDYSITYRCITMGAEPAIPELWAFRTRDDGKIDYYPNTMKEAGNFHGGMPYFVYYPNGEVAISINDGRVGPRLTVYSMSKKDESGRMIDSRPQAMFDTKGNGVVWDLDGRMKMNYDQIEGALYFNNARPVLHWYWKESTYLRMRRADLDGLAADHNDDIDPNRPNQDSSRSRTATSKSSSKGSKKSGKGKRKSRTPGKRKSMARKSKTAARKSKTGARKSRTGGKSRKTKVGTGKRKSKVGKRGGESKGYKGNSNKRGTRADAPPLRKRPSRVKPITEVAPIPVKISDYVSMRILSQQHIHLDYEFGHVHYRMHLGVNIKPEIVERIDKVVHPKRMPNITPCYFELMPLRSMSLYNVHQKLREIRQDAARREFKRSVRTITGFYSWWHKKKMVKFQKGISRNPEKSVVRMTNERKINT